MKEMSVVKNRLSPRFAWRCAWFTAGVSCRPQCRFGVSANAHPGPPVRPDLWLALWIVVRTGGSCPVYAVYRYAPGCDFTCYDDRAGCLRVGERFDDDLDPHQENLPRFVHQLDHRHANRADCRRPGEGFHLCAWSHHHGHLGCQLFCHQPAGHHHPACADPDDCLCTDERQADPPALSKISIRALLRPNCPPALREHPMNQQEIIKFLIAVHRIGMQK